MTLSKKINQLEKWVEKMESEETDLDESIQLYSKSIKLAQEISETFQHLQKEMEILQEDGSIVTTQLCV